EMFVYAASQFTPEALEPCIHVRQDVRVADADERNGLVAAEGCAFELDGRLLCGDEDGTLYAGDPIVHGGVDGFARVERPAGFAQPERVRVLVQHVRGHRHRGRCRSVVEWMDAEARVIDLDEHSATERVGGALTAAF